MTRLASVRFGASLGAVVLSMGLAFSHFSTAAPPPRAAAPSAPVSHDGAWSRLSNTQRQALQPLASSWPTMEGTNRERWVNVANRFGSLSPIEQRRMQDRMTQWSKLPAQQRGEARLRFQQTRQLSPDERQKKWASYQALSPEQRGDLAQQAQRKQRPVVLGDNVNGPREQGQQSARRHRDNQQAVKSNWVPGVAPNAPVPVAVAPSLIKAGRGATTSLVSQRPTPPLHQQSGLTKIAGSKGFVDPVTLLPKKGAQGAAMTTTPASQPR